ncbi:MAG: hypothetical protein ABR928_22970 [Terracidiphilus sp.]|jgi:hypothetical protein
MINLNPQNGNAAAISPLRFCALFFVPLLLFIPGTLGFAQSGLSGKGATSTGQSSVDSQHQSLDYGSDTASGSFDSIMVERRMKLLNSERHKALISDSDKLFKLATELNNEIARANSGVLTPEQLRKVAEIEKLAHGVRDKMTMTLIVPSPTVTFPNYGPPFNQ